MRPSLSTLSFFGLVFGPLASVALALPTAPLTAALSTQSATDAFDFDAIPVFRGSGSANYSGWDVFTVPVGPSNLPDDPASDLTSSIEQTTPGAIVTSTMNIYHPGAALNFILEAASTEPLRQAVLQVRSFGNALDDASFRLAHDSAQGTLEWAPTSSQVLTPSPGFAEEKLFVFDVPGSAGDFTDFRIEFGATASNCSLDAVLLDVRTDGKIGASYCSAVPNSTGQVGSLEAWGSAVAAHNEFELHASSLPPSTFGLFVASMSQDSIPMAGGSEGTLCLGGSIGRLNALIFNSGASGTQVTTIDLSALPTPSGAVQAAAGETWNFQCWHRDANPVATSNFTAPVSILFR